MTEKDNGKDMPGYVSMCDGLSQSLSSDKNVPDEIMTKASRLVMEPRHLLLPYSG